MQQRFVSRSSKLVSCVYGYARAQNGDVGQCGYFGATNGERQLLSHTERPDETEP